MNGRNLMDLINCDSEDKEKMIEAVKEKLRWYTFEASEEEFDTEAVDALVKFLREVEPELGKTSEKENDKPEREQKKRVIKLNRGRIAAAVVIGALVLTLASVIVGNSLGTTLAWEEDGFFRWLRKDEKGQTMITSPEDLGMGIGSTRLYSDFLKVPTEYRQYLIKPEEIEGLEVAEVNMINVIEDGAFVKVNLILLLDETIEIKLGVTIFEDAKNVVRDSFDDYEYLETENNGICEQKIFSKRNHDMKMEYAICFYDSNKKYYISSCMMLSELKDIANSYMAVVLSR